MATYDICSLEEIKDFMGIDGSVTKDDNLFESLITKVTDWFHSYCGVDQFKQKTYTEYYGGNNDRFLYVDNPPIISITSLHDDTDWSWGATELIAATDYMIVDSKYVVLKDDSFYKGDQNIKIVYSGGYATIPQDLKHACTLEVSRIYNTKGEQGITSKSSGVGSSLSYDPNYLLTSTINILRKYKVNGVY